MSMKILEFNKYFLNIKCENRISLWNILKFGCESPFLKHYIVENYEGGNTLVPIETWNEEGITYKEIEKGIYLFPYESIGFVINDNISNITLYVIDRYEDGFNFRENFELVIKIVDTDNLELLVNKIYLFNICTIYLLSMMEIGFDINLFNNLSETIKSINGDKIYDLAYVDSSLIFTFSGINFILKIYYNENDYEYYQIQCSKKCTKKLIKSNEIKSFSIMKKKILKKNKFYPLIYYSVLSIFFIIILFLLKKYIFIILLIIILFLLLKTFIKKNIYKIYNKL